MNKEQLDAIKARLEKYFDTCSIRESEMLAMYMGEEDVPALIAEVERLRGVISEALEASEKLGCSIECELAEKEQLREALEFYADREQYAEKMEANKGLCMYRPIMRDKGKTARKALRNEQHE